MKTFVVKSEPWGHYQLRRMSTSALRARLKKRKPNWLPSTIDKMERHEMLTYLKRFEKLDWLEERKVSHIEEKKPNLDFAAGVLYGLVLAAKMVEGRIK